MFCIHISNLVSYATSTAWLFSSQVDAIIFD